MIYFVEGLTNVAGSESSVRHIGEYKTIDEAVSAAKSIVDEFLIANKRDGITVSDLYAKYRNFGEVPFIFCDGDRTVNVRDFNHFDYAIRKCTAICLGTDGE
jgi:hypothetical protein